MSSLHTCVCDPTRMNAGRRGTQFAVARAVRKLVLLLLIVAFTPDVALAESFVLTSTIIQRYAPNPEGGFSFPQYDVTGTMDISSVPTIIDVGDRYKVWYRIAVNFLFGNGVNLVGTGAMIVDGNGCGLFDCNITVPVADSDGNHYRWNVGDGAFFYPDGTRYPSVFQSALPYVVPPERFELYASDVFVEGPAGYPYYFNSPIVATRAPVPEPSTLLLTGLGALALLKRTRGGRAKHFCRLALW